MENTKNVYWILSGEGENGTWERVETTLLGIKQRLTLERCDGNRWARAFGDIYKTATGYAAGCDIESGEIRGLPDDALFDIED